LLNGSEIKLINGGAAKRYLYVETSSSKSDHARLLNNEEYGATK
jgi:ureidoglycolate hydrolase